MEGSSRLVPGEGWVRRFDLRAVDPEAHTAGPVLVELPPSVMVAGERFPVARILSSLMPVYETGPEGRSHVADTVAYDLRFTDGRSFTGILRDEFDVQYVATFVVE